MAQRFLAPELIAEGVIKQNGTISNDNHVVTRGYLHSNVINGIHPDSANYASVVADGGVNKLKIDPLTITSVTVNTTATDLADFIANVYTGSNFQEGDIVFLTTPSPIESYIHNGGTAGTSADWNLVNSGLSDAQIRAKFSASAGIDYNSSTGEFTADQSEIQGFFSAGTGLAYSGGQFSLNATSDQITEGSNNLFHTDARARGAVSVASVAGPDVQLLQYNNSTGVLSVELSDVFAEFSAGTGLSYSNGVYSINADTDDVTEGTNLYFTDARARGAVQADPAAGNLLTFNQSSGDIALMLSSLRKGFFNQSLTANTGLVLTHSLGERLVHVSAMDGSGNHIDLEIVYTSKTQVTVKSVQSLTGIDIAVSI